MHQKLKKRCWQIPIGIVKSFLIIIGFLAVPFTARADFFSYAEKVAVNFNDGFVITQASLASFWQGMTCFFGYNCPNKPEEITVKTPVEQAITNNKIVENKVPANNIPTSEVVDDSWGGGSVMSNNVPVETDGQSAQIIQNIQPTKEIQTKEIQTIHTNTVTEHTNTVIVDEETKNKVNLLLRQLDSDRPNYSVGQTYALPANLLGSTLNINNSAFSISASGDANAQNITTEHDLTVRGNFTVSGTQTYSGAAEFSASSTSPVIYAANTGSGLSLRADNVTLKTGTINTTAGNLILNSNTGLIEIAASGVKFTNAVPSDTSMALYNDSGTLKWNGAALAMGSSVSGTIGYLPKFTSSNALGNSALFESGGNVGIGTMNPQSLFHVAYNGYSPLIIQRNSNNQFSQSFIAYKGRGTIESPTAAQNGDMVGGFQGNIFDGSDYQSYVGAIQFHADGAPGVDNSPGRITFWTTPSGSNASTERMRITSVGNVGIGTNAPLNHLVIGAAVGQTIALQDASDVKITTGTGLRSDTSFNSNFDALGGIRMNLDVDGNSVNDFRVIDGADNVRFLVQEDGNIGIGTSTPGAKLDVAGNIAIGGNQLKTTNALLKEDGDVNFLTIRNAADSGYKGLKLSEAVINTKITLPLGTVGAPAVVFTGDTDTGLWSSGADTVNFSTAGSERARISSAGNFGIGTVAPGSLLEVSNANNSYAGLAGQARINSTAASGAQAALDLTVSGAMKGRVRADSAGNLSLASYGTDMGFYTGGDSGAGTAKIYMTNGNVGIGTTSPTYKLAVDGAAGSTSGLQITNLGTATYGINMASSGLSGSSDYLFYADATNYWRADGVLYSSLQAYTPSLYANYIYGQTSNDLTLGVSTSGRNVIINPTSGNIGIGTATPTGKFTVRYDASGAIADLLRFENLGTAAASSTIGMQFIMNRTTGGATEYSRVDSQATSIDNTYFSGMMRFKIAANGSLDTVMEMGNPNVVINRPLQVNVAGDTGISYDLQMMSVGTSHITSNGPLVIAAGDINHSENLTLTTQSNEQAGDFGTATAGAATTMTDSTRAWVVDEWIGGTVTIVTGNGKGQTQTITDNDATSITVADWDTTLGDPAVNSVYRLSYAPGGDILVDAVNSNNIFGGFKMLGSDNGGYAFRVAPDGDVFVGGEGAGGSDLFVKQNIIAYGSISSIRGLDISSAGTPTATSATSGGSCLDSTPYYYKVTALNDNGETIGTSQFTVTTGASGTNVNLITVAWSTVTGATGYKIYRSTENNDWDGDANDSWVDGRVVAAPTVTYQDNCSGDTASLTPPTANGSGGKLAIGLATPSYALDVLASGANIARFNGTNNTGCTLSDGGIIACSSDERLKKNVDDLDYGIGDIMELRPVSFVWNHQEDDASTTAGFIAQEVEAVLPGLVMTDGNGYKELNTIGLVPVLTKAIQEQQKEIQDLREFTLGMVIGGDGSLAGGSTALEERKNSLISWLVEGLRGLGVSLGHGIARIANLEVGTPENPNGITIYDQTTKEPYCITVDGGQMKQVKGKGPTVVTESGMPADEAAGNMPPSGGVVNEQPADLPVQDGEPVIDDDGEAEGNATSTEAEVEEPTLPINEGGQSSTSTPAV